MITKRSLSLSLLALLLGGAFCVPLPTLPSSSQVKVASVKPSAPAVKPAPKPAKQKLAPLTDKQRYIVLYSYVCAIYYGESGSNCLNPAIYYVRYTGIKAKSLRDHPDHLGEPIPGGWIRGKWVRSAASGAGQWMPDTWDHAVAYCRTIGFYDDKATDKFSPENQNSVMACYLNKLGALSRLYRDSGQDSNGNIVIDQQAFDESIYHVAGVWMSLPTSPNDTDGAADQGANRISTVRKAFHDYIPVFTKALSRLK